MVGRLMRRLKRYKTIAVDFDGCLCQDRFPQIGAPNLPLLSALRDVQKQGTLLILWTCRCDEILLAAIKWCGLYGLHFDAVNANLKDNISKYGNDCRKVNADLYLDDKAWKIQARRKR